MNRTASSLLSNLEMRVAHLEMQRRASFSMMQAADPTSAEMYRKIIRELKLDNAPLTSIGFSVTKRGELEQAIRALLINASSATGTVYMLRYADRKVVPFEVNSGLEFLDLFDDPNLRLSATKLKVTILGMKFSLAGKAYKLSLKAML